MLIDYQGYEFYYNIKEKMLTIESTLDQRLNSVDVSNLISWHGIQQWENPIQHSNLCAVRSAYHRGAPEKAQT